MKLVLLGTNGFHPTDDAQTACYMLPELGIVLDAGSGLYRITNHLQTPSLDIYLSHAHSDHIIGLAYLIGAILEKEIAESQLPICDENVGVIGERTHAFMRKVRVHAAKSVLTDVKNEAFLDKPDVQWLSLEEEEQLPGNGILTHFAVDHTAECYGFRLDWPGHSLAYVTDTVAKLGAPYVENIRGVDLLLHECYLPSSLSQFSEAIGHSHTLPVAQVSAEAQVGRLILIHHNTLGLRIGGSELTSARDIFPETEVGLDGMEIEF